MVPVVSIQTDIASKLDSYPPSMRRIAEAIIRTPTLVIDHTISELAQQCQTSETSVVRFCRTLGFTGYAPLRLKLANELGTEQGGGGHPVPHSGEHGADISPEDTAAQVIAKVTAADVAAIRETATSLDPDVLEQVADAVSGANRILVFGVGASATAARDLQQKLLRIDRVALSSSDAHDAMVVAGTLSRGDVAIVFSHTGRTREAIEMVRAAHDSGATTVVVTNVAGSPLAQLADHVLRTAVREMTFRSGAMASRMAQLAMVDYVFVLVAQRNYEGAVDALKHTYDSVRVLRDDR